MKKRITQEEIKELQNKLLDGNKKVDDFLVKISDADIAINGEDGFVETFKGIDTEIKNKLSDIQEAHEEIIGSGDTDDISIQEQLNNLVEILEEKQRKIESLDSEIFGQEITKEDGIKEVIPGTSNKLDELVKKHSALYQKIEHELEAGTTSVALAKVFSDKVNSYSTTEDKYSKIFIVFLYSLILYGILTVSINEYIHNLDSWEQIFKHLLLSLPFLAFSIWLLIFIGNRRAESKKLEESYKHKEVMARAFVGYQESIKELDTEDNSLLEKHMENLLDAINKDSSDFLDSKGEKHPFFEIFAKLVDKFGFPEKIDTELGSIEFKKK